MKFNLFWFKKYIFFIILGVSSSNHCYSMLPSDLIIKQKETIKKSLKTSQTQPILKRKKIRFNLQQLLLKIEIENVSELEILKALIPRIKEQTCETIDQFKDGILELLNNNEILTTWVDEFIKISKETFCDKKLLNTLINTGKIDLSSHSIPSFTKINLSRYHESDEIDEETFNQIMDICESIDQTIFDDFFLKRIIIDIFSKIRSIVKLDLHKNYLIEIPTHIIELKNLEKLNLLDNQITEDISEQAIALIQQMPSLSYLNLSNTEYYHDNFPEKLAHLKKIENYAIYLNEKELIKNKLIQKIDESNYQIFNILFSALNPIFPNTNKLQESQPGLKLENIVDRLIEKIIKNIENNCFIDNWKNGYKGIIKNTLKQTYKKIAPDFYLLHKEKINELDQEITNHLTNIIEETLQKNSE